MCQAKKHSHVDLLHMIGGVDYAKGSIVSGNRGYYLKGPGVHLENALIQLAMHHAYAKVKAGARRVHASARTRTHTHTHTHAYIYIYIYICIYIYVYILVYMYSYVHIM